MPWRDLLDPNRMVGRAAKWFCCLLALLMLIPLGTRLIAQVPWLGMALAVCLVAFIAHAVRNHQAVKPNRVRSVGRAERTPVMPIMEDDE
jgi:fatty acid desaturase